MATKLGLVVAVLAVSWASILVRWSGETPALVIAGYRMFWSAALFSLIFWKNREKYPGQALNFRKNYLLTLTAGLFLALHFATWIASLKFTTVAHSLIIESTQPVFAVLLSPFLLKEKAGWRTLISVFLAAVGIVIIAGQDLDFQGQEFWGDLLALISALCITLYIFIARGLRHRMSFIPYLAAVYFSAFLALLIFNLVAGSALFAYSWKVHLVMFLLALVPTGIGHTLINWTARRMEVYKVNIALLGEPVLASVMAYYFFGEKPYGLFYAGAIFIVAGIFLALTETRNTTILDV